MTFTTSSAFAVASALLLPSAAFSQTVLLSDDFEVDSSADYTVVDDGSIDGVDDFAFNYMAAGLPLAPRSDLGDFFGLKMTANTSAAAGDSRTIFHNTPIVEDRYRVTVDLWMNFTGSAGTTEFAHMGVGGDGMTYNRVFSPISGSGAFLSVTGDGGSGSDFRWFRDSANTPADESDSTTLPNSHPSYLGHGSNNTGTFFQALYPSPPSTIAGAPGNIWTTAEIEVDNTCGVIAFYLDSALVFRGKFAGDLNGQVSLTLADVFSSVGIADSFTVYDNLLVETIPSVGTAYCAVTPNSTGAGAVLLGNGSTAAADNAFTLCALDMPQDSFGIFVASSTSDFVVNPGGSMGNLCIGPAIGRGVGGVIANSGAAGSFVLDADLTAIPTPNGPVAVMPGDSVYFQAWFRDAVGGTTTSNYSNGLQVDFN